MLDLKPSFIHGGAWRDPTNTYQDFLPTINSIISSASPPLSSIRGFASLDYRLSSHPNKPQAPDTPAAELRRAAHPDHVRDVRAGLEYLDATYDIGDRYILIGHSVGATLAFQVLMGAQAAGADDQPPPPRDLPLPAAILGIAGIYEFHDFAHRGGPAYIEMVEGALGSDHPRWNEAAPLRFRGSYAGAWPAGRHVLLSYSPGDTLVDGNVETDAMVQRLRGDGCAVSTLPTHGEHDFVWQDGAQIASLIHELLQKIA